MDCLAVIPGDTLHHDHSALKDGQTTFFMAETTDLLTNHAHHTHKLILFLASMRHHRDHLRAEDETVIYKEHVDEQYKAALRDTIKEHNPDKVTTYQSKDKGFTAVKQACEATNTAIEHHPNPNFICDENTLKDYFDRNPYRHASFYQWQRREHDVLLNDDKTPINGKWSFDTANREPLPTDKHPPELPDGTRSNHVEDVKQLVSSAYADRWGNTRDFWLPTKRSDAKAWLDRFLTQRFNDFGPYQDAISKDEPFIYHAVISPMLNTGLLSPDEVIDQAVNHWEDQNTHFPSVEGFIRQILGWREFIRGVHLTQDLTSGNHFNNESNLNEAWYTASTGLPPVDDAITQASKTGYAHHIQRLMVLSNAMLLTGIHPDEAYEWFMEFFVDSAPWVMEPNVYDMGQYATGGVFATKPYISSSNYLLKMSDYEEGSWCEDWDALYWSFLHEHQGKLAQNHRMGLMLSHLDKKSEDELTAYQRRAASVKNRLTA